jgi:hypothetical protein
LPGVCNVQRTNDRSTAGLLHFVLSRVQTIYIARNQPDIRLLLAHILDELLDHSSTDARPSACNYDSFDISAFVPHDISERPGPQK